MCNVCGVYYKGMVSIRVCVCVCLFVGVCLFLRFCVFENCRLRSVVRAGPYSSVVEHPLSKRKVGSSILPGGKCLHSFHALALAASLVSDAFLAHAFFLSLPFCAGF